MKILMLSQTYPKWRGDRTAPFVESIATSLVARGAEVHMVLPEHPELRRQPVEGGVHFHVYHYAPRPDWRTWGYGESLHADVRIKQKNLYLAPLVFGQALRLVDRVIARERIEIVHAHWVLPNGPIAALAARRHGLPLIISLHGSDLFLAEKSALWKRAARWSFAQARTITAPSDDMIDRAVRLGANPSRLELVLWGADAHVFDVPAGEAQALRSRLGLGPSDLMLLAIGRLLYVKGFTVLLDAMAGAPANVRLVLVGEGEMRQELQSQVDRLGLTGRVLFTGGLPHSDIPVYLAASDLVAIPSIHGPAGNVDGLPTVALEALAAGKAVIASKVAGLPHVIADGVNGVLVPEKDPARLARAILELSDDPERRLRMGAMGRARIQADLSWDNVACKFMAIYERARR